MRSLRRNWTGLLVAIAAAGALSLVLPTFASAQNVSPNVNPESSVQPSEGVGGAGYVQPDTVFVPQSSVARPEDAGKFAHTNYVLRTANGAKPAPMVSPNLAVAETPASLGCVYGVGPYYAGCNPATGGTQHPSGGWGAIALVDAFDNPNARYDIFYFSGIFGLPAPNFTKVYANGNGHCTTPPANAGWALEESLDIEWAHVMAPNAKIYLVEACSNSNADLYYAETVAHGLVAAAGGGEISNSWGENEYGGEIVDDLNFFYYSDQLPGWGTITTFASAGDSGCGAQYPSSSPWVVSAGGTRVNRNYLGNFKNEACWSGSGGGISAVETWSNTFTGGNTGAWADYQYPIFGEASRRTPDMSFDADPDSGVYVFSKYYGGWFIVGGTSVSSPALAGIVNNARNKLGNYFLPPINPIGYFNTEENNLLYSQLPALREYHRNFYDVTLGSNGCTVTNRWDYCTGVGSPRGLVGK
jgi:kumamolisin